MNWMVLQKLKFIPERKLLEWYPPFFFMGVHVREISPDYRKIDIHLPLRWYGKNMHGSMFGGFICAVSDPLPVLMCLKLFPEADVWTKRHDLEFLKPARSGLDLHMEIKEEDEDRIHHALEKDGQASYTFYYQLRDSRGRGIAQVSNTVFLRRKSR